MLQIGSLFWAVIPEDAKLVHRACVVTACSPYARHQHVVEVVYGQDHPPQHALAAYKVEKNSLLGRRLRLSKTTYFCTRTEIYVSTIDKDKVCDEMCPDMDQLMLEEIAEGQR